MQKLQEEKKRLESNNELLKEQNRILNEQMMKKSEKIKENGVQIEGNNKKIMQIEKILKVKMRENIWNQEEINAKRKSESKDYSNRF